MLKDRHLRVCVPLWSDGVGHSIAEDWQLAPHFGLAERFAVVDSISGEIVDECEISGYCPGPCHCPLPNLVDSGVDALAGESVGFRLLQLSRRAKLPVWAVKAKTLGELRRDMSANPPTRVMSAGKCLSNTPRQRVGTKK